MSLGSALQRRCLSRSVELAVLGQAPGHSGESLSQARLVYHPQGLSLWSLSWDRGQPTLLWTHQQRFLQRARHGTHQQRFLPAWPRPLLLLRHHPLVAVLIRNCLLMAFISNLVVEHLVELSPLLRLPQAFRREKSRGSVRWHRCRSSDLDHAAQRCCVPVWVEYALLVGLQRCPLFPKCTLLP